MKHDDIKILLKEAKHSVMLLMQSFGSISSPCNQVLLKWPDILDSYFDNNDENLRRDFAIIICQPIKIIADSLVERIKLIGLLDSSSFEIEQTMVLAIKSPLEAKANLLRICNSLIFKLKSGGVDVDYIKSNI